jgi:hypothetical protein
MCSHRVHFQRVRVHFPLFQRGRWAFISAHLQPINFGKLFGVKPLTAAAPKMAVWGKINFLTKF